jgi:hypothetical protein
MEATDETNLFVSEAGAVPFLKMQRFTRCNSRIRLNGGDKSNKYLCEWSGFRPFSQGTARSNLQKVMDWKTTRQWRDKEGFEVLLITTQYAVWWLFCVCEFCGSNKRVRETISSRGFTKISWRMVVFHFLTTLQRPITSTAGGFDAQSLANGDRTAASSSKIDDNSILATQEISTTCSRFSTS